MSIYALWNNKGGVGKSYLTFQIASEYARTHLDRKILVVDLCPQANSSGMLLGGMRKGEEALDILGAQTPRMTISGYMEDRIRSPYVNPHTGASYAVRVADHNWQVPGNLFLIAGDEQLEIQASRVLGATLPGPTDAWRIVHTWIRELVEDVQTSWNQQDATVFIDCNPSFSIYTELALSAADRLIIPFSADGSSKRAVRAVLALLYGVTRAPGAQQSQFFLNSRQFKLTAPRIYCYVGNRLTQYVSSAKAFRTIVHEIGEEIHAVWQKNPNVFHIHPAGEESPRNRRAFNEMFQSEIPDANTASVVSSSLGIPIVHLTAGQYEVAGRRVQVNQSQIEKQQENMQQLVVAIE
uniref:AAA domain-containing protein n=1 Tax=Candidatus Kentrum sp. FW TaxID=2126338 RepID=A0A450U0E5_9GAMM|nr:MAG: AAA domain-containing protein [Candidatus Kentron sp. FW]